MQNVLISGSFIIEPLRKSLDFWAKEIPLAYEISFAPYNHVFQTLIQHKGRDDILILILRSKDLGEGNYPLFLDYLRRASEGRSSPLFVIYCSESDQEFLSQITEISGVHLIALEAWLKTYQVSKIHNPFTENDSHMPYEPLVYVVLGTVIARILYSLQAPLIKLIAVDGDNTLWSGVLAEEPVEMHTEFQQWLLQRHLDGISIALFSKNEPSDVDLLFETHQDMTLKKEHMTACYINWNDKGSNLSDLTKKMNIGPEAVLFFDDNPLECATVASAIPESVVVQFDKSCFEHLWDIPLFHRRTLEDSARTNYYQQQFSREELKESKNSYSDFFRELNLKVEIHPIHPHEVERVSQLTQRTNQFNASTIRRTPGEILEYLKQENHSIYVVHAEDRFGNYGLVGTFFIENQLVDTFLLSCRVLGLGIEYQMASFIGNTFSDSKVIFRYMVTTRNRPIRIFFKTIGVDDDFSMDSKKLSQVVFEPVQPSFSEALIHDIKQSDSRSLNRSQFAKFTNSLRTAESIQLKMRKNDKSPVVYAETELEKIVSNCIASVLNRECVGIDDHFFGLGGDSFEAAQLTFRLSEATHREVDIVDIFNHPVVRNLAHFIATRPDTPASLEQLAIWYGMQAARQRSVYEIQLSYQFEGFIDVEKLNRCIKILQNRYEILNTSFKFPSHNIPITDYFSYTLTSSKLDLKFHHIICDEASIALFMEELTALYRDENAKLDSLSSYVTYCKKQNRQVPEETRLFWNQELPCKTVPSCQDRTAGHFHVPIPAYIYEMGKTYETTPFIICLSLFALSYRKIMKNDDFLVAIPFSTRKQECSFGLYVNLLPIRCQLTDAMTFKEIVSDLQAKIAKTSLHRSTPFFQVQESQKLNVVFNWNRRIGQTPYFEGAKTTRVQCDAPFVEFDLNFTIEEESDGLEIHVQYAKAAFEEQQIQKMVDFSTWVAIETEELTLTYKSLHEIVNQYAYFLLDKGLTTQKGAVVCLENNLEQILASLAVLKTGGFFIPLDFKSPSEFRNGLIENISPHLIIDEFPWDQLAKYPNTDPKIKISPTDIAYLIHTSGTTGTPKKVVIQHGDFTHRMRIGAELFQVSPGCKLLSQGSPSFDLHIAEWGLALFNGATLCPYSGTPSQLMPFMKKMKVSHTLLTPGLLSILHPEELPDLKNVMVCGEVTPQPLLEKWQPYVTVFNGYGPTECTIFTHIHRFEPNQSSRIIGRPIPGITCYVADEQGNPVSAGTIGELIIDHFNTKDLVREVPDGLYEYIERKAELVKINGCRLDPYLVANTLMTLPDISEAVVTPYDNQGLACYYSGTFMESKQLRNELQKRLPSYMIPTHYFHLDELPRQISGKLDKKALTTNTQIKLSAFWQELIKKKPQDGQDDFFEMGGDSLQAVHLLIMIWNEWNMEIGMEDLREHSTLSELAQWIDSQKGGIQTIIPIQKEGNLPPLFLVHPASGFIECYRPLAEYLPDQPIYGVQNPFTVTKSIEEMAANYVAEIKKTFPLGPYSLGGWSLGGNIALEMASILCETGEVVNEVILWDSFHPAALSSEVSHNPKVYTGFVHLIRSTTHSLTNNGWNNLPNCFISEVNVEHAEMFDLAHIPQVALRL